MANALAAELPADGITAEKGKEAQEAAG